MLLILRIELLVLSGFRITAFGSGRYIAGPWLAMGRRALQGSCRVLDDEEDELVELPAPVVGAGVVGSGARATEMPNTEKTTMSGMEFRISHLQTNMILTKPLSSLARTSRSFYRSAVAACPALHNLVSFAGRPSNSATRYRQPRARQKSRT